MSVQGTDRTATTGSDGRFRITGLPAGVDRVARIEGAEIESETRLVTLEPGGSTDVTFELITEGDEIIVEDKRLQATAAKELLIRRLSDEVVDSIGSEELGKTAVSDVGGAVKQLPAVTIVGGRFAYVRGLGERYSQTLLDGSSLPSPEPDKKVVPLDLFPIGMIESVRVAKTYSPDLPGEFAGGSIQASTIGVPVARFLKLSVSGKYVDGTTFRDFATYEGGNLDRFGYDDGSRALPDEVPSVPVTGGSGGLSPMQLQVIGRAFDNIWEPDIVTAPIDAKVALSYGDSWEFGDLGKIGLIASGQWSNKYRTVDDEEFTVLVPGVTGLRPFNEYTIDTSSFEAEIAAVIAATIEFSPAQSITWRNLITRSTTDRVRQQEGIDGQLGEEVRITQFKYVERLLMNSQLSGEHLLVGDLLFNWRSSLSYTERDQPDTRQNKYAFEASADDFVWQDETSSGSHDFYYLDEIVTDNGLDLAIPFNPFDIDDPNADPLAVTPAQYVKFGAAYTHKDREFDTRKFRFIPNSSGGAVLDENGNVVDLTLPPEILFQEKNINPQGFILRETTVATDNYEAEATLAAAYVSTSFRVHRDIRIAGGARVESSEQEVRTFGLSGSPPPTQTTKLDDTDVLPAVNVSWEFAKDQQLRLGASQTVTRPEFRELAPFAFTDLDGGYTVRGNPDLERGLLQNYDIRWEWYPTPGEIVSASVFAKTIEDPIEVVNLPTASSLITSFDNAEEAEIYGIELEGRKELGFIGSGWDVLSLRGNFAWIESEVTVDDLNVTNQSRPLQGQPEWTANLGLFYDDGDWNAGILANAFGERISAVGTSGLPDEYEQTRWVLDVTVSKEFENGSKLRLSFENLLNSEFLFEVGGETSRKFTTGVAIGLSYSIEL